MQVGRKSQVAKSDIKWTLCGKKFWTGCNQGSNSSSVEENNNRTGKDKDRKSSVVKDYSSFVISLTIAKPN